MWHLDQRRLRTWTFEVSVAIPEREPARVRRHRVAGETSGQPPDLPQRKRALGRFLFPHRWLRVATQELPRAGDRYPIHRRMSDAAVRRRNLAPAHFTLERDLTLFVRRGADDLWLVLPCLLRSCDISVCRMEDPAVRLEADGHERAHIEFEVTDARNDPIGGRNVTLKLKRHAPDHRRSDRPAKLDGESAALIDIQHPRQPRPSRSSHLRSGHNANAIRAPNAITLTAARGPARKRLDL